MFSFFCKILQHPKINPESAPGFTLERVRDMTRTYSKNNHLPFFAYFSKQDMIFFFFFASKKLLEAATGVVL